MADKDAMSSHLDNAIYGPPKLHPDEQRQYLGTFRERVSLLITIGQLEDQSCQTGFADELKAHPDYKVIFNGHVDSDILAPYMKLATAQNVEFTIVQDDFYGDQATSSGLVVISDHAINVYPIDVAEKYPNKPTTQSQPTQKKSFGDRLKNLFSGH